MFTRDYSGNCSYGRGMCVSRRSQSRWKEAIVMDIKDSIIDRNAIYEYDDRHDYRSMVCLLYTFRNLYFVQYLREILEI